MCWKACGAFAEFSVDPADLLDDEAPVVEDEGAEVAEQVAGEG
ncbi:hypothetical protein [Micromonospora rosaria]|nr:hypothetical protein [Micromonospora rosaria]